MDAEHSREGLARLFADLLELRAKGSTGEASEADYPQATEDVV